MTVDRSHRPIRVRRHASGDAARERRPWGERDALVAVTRRPAFVSCNRDPGRRECVTLGRWLQRSRSDVRLAIGLCGSDSLGRL